MTQIFVMLGRTGDILSILPLFYSTFQKTGEKQILMVAKEYATILEGVSYVTPVVYDGSHYEITKAVAFAKTMAEKVICLQVNGPVSEIKEHTYNGTHAISTSFEKEMFRLAGRLGEWDDCLPLVFDQRDMEREKKLLRDNGLMFRGYKKPMILLSLKSNSSPFPYADLLKEFVTLKFGATHRIVELPQAERIYDLLGYYDRAELLIAIDSAPLHLAWACRKLPVFALTQDRPILWNGSPWRPNHLWYCRYHDWPERAVEMNETILSFEPNRKSPDYVTVWSDYNNKTVYYPRNEVLPVSLGACGRDSGNTLKDSKRHPYLRDVIRMAIQRACGDESKIYLTRKNVSIKNENCPIPISFSYRMSHDQFSPIADLFCATRKQWKNMLPDIPDLVLSDDYVWSQCLWAVFKKHGGTDATGCCKFEEFQKQTQQQTKIIHHPITPSMAHNQTLCEKYISENRVFSRYPRATEQAECLPVEIEKLHKFAYNPSIIQFGGRTIMAYRWQHHYGEPTKLAIAVLDDGLKVKTVHEITPPGDMTSMEDPCLFEHNGKLHILWVVSQFPKAFKSVVKYAELNVP
jgi:hypothetical protein